MGGRLAAFDYHLPPDRIAQHPPERRGASRLLVVRRDVDRFEDRTFNEFPLLVPRGDLLVVNSTRVRAARFLGTRPSGAPAEVLLLHPATGDAWVALGKPGSALRPGRRVIVAPELAIETIEILRDGNRVVRFVGLPAEEAIARFGRIPLPPYITREAVPADRERYQTVYAEHEGSVAAPTAGLHFTAELLATLQDRGVAVASVDLEVGPGTFKPVETEDLSDHPMHPERYRIPEATTRAIHDTRARGGMIWAIGTTVVRALESAAREDGSVRAGEAETALFIRPGFRFRVADRLLTNFHLPRSTLLMLVSAFLGHARTMAAYRHAIREGYRFYSYGDAMVVP